MGTTSIIEIISVETAELQLISSEDILQYLVPLLEHNQEEHPPASKAAIESLEKAFYNSGVCKESGCTICKEDYKENEAVILMPCKHCYHPDCLIPWLEQHNSCPSCRYKLLSDNDSN